MDNLRPLALVTGASSGIGAEFARQLARKGYGLVLVARRRERMEELASALGGAEIITADLVEDSGVELIERRIAAADHLDVLVNNAGFGSRGLFHELDPAVNERMHRLHILATMRLTQAALAGMIRRNRGGIINVSSVAAFMPSPGNVSYHATKAWMNEFTEGIYLELKKMRSAVRVQALCPGYTWSEFHDVLGIDRSGVPKNWWLPTEFVVAKSLRGLERGDLFVIPSLRYRAVVALMRHIPRRIRHAIMARATERFRRPSK